MPRRSGPTLYEVMSQSAASTRTNVPSRIEPDRPTNSRLLTPGSVIRVPVGFVWIGLIVGVILLVSVYWMGSGRGFEAGRKEGEQVRRSMREMERASTLRREPSAGLGSSGRSASTSPQAGSIPGRTARTRVSAPAGGFSLDRTIDVETDRRQAGWTYKVVLYTKLESALDVARSIRQNGSDLGVDAMVERSHNGRLGTVILLPGSPQPFTTAQMNEWDLRIDELAERVADDSIWRGERPFAGHYAETFGQ